MKLVSPSIELVPSYISALERGWCPMTVNRRPLTADEITQVRTTAPAIAERCDCRNTNGEKVRLPDGRMVDRIPSYTRWIWDGEFCGWINFRWQPGTSLLPPHILGHVGFVVVDWHQGRGFARAALTTVVEEARGMGMPWIEATADEDNDPSRRVIERCGGVLVEIFSLPEDLGGQPAVRYRIPTAAPRPGLSDHPAADHRRGGGGHSHPLPAISASSVTPQAETTLPLSIHSTDTGPARVSTMISGRTASTTSASRS